MRTSIVAVLLTTCSIFAQNDIMVDTVPTGEVPSREIPAPIVQPSPVQVSTPVSTPAVTPINTPVGSLRIITGSPTAQIFLDGKLVGTSECLVNNVPIGRHDVFILDDNISSSIEAYAIEGVTRIVKKPPERETFVSITSSFSNIWCKGVRAFGPSLDLGVQHKASYYGINFHWGFFNDGYWGGSESDSKGSGICVGGAALQWYYSLYTYKDIFNIAPGLASGFWYFEGARYVASPESTTTGYYDQYDFVEEMFFIGPSLRLGVGFKRIYFNCAYTMLIGTHLAHALVVGARFVL